MDGRRRNKKNIIGKPLLIVSALLLLTLLYVSLAFIQSWWPFPRETGSDTSNSASTQESAQTQSRAEVDTKNDYVNSHLYNSNKGQQTTPDVLISMDSYRYSNEVVVISTRLGTIPDGACTLTVTNGERQDVQTADIIYQPMYSTCAGFSVQVSKLGNGTWNIVLKVESRGRQYSTSGTTVVK